VAWLREYEKAVRANSGSRGVDNCAWAYLEEFEGLLAHFVKQGEFQDCELPELSEVEREEEDPVPLTED
jgi:hypothetical protein